MTRKKWEQAVFAAAASLVLVLGLAVLNSSTKALLYTGHDSSHSALHQSRAAVTKASATTEKSTVASAQVGGWKGGKWPELWGREVGFRPGMGLPNLGRTKGSWEGVRADSGTRSPYYGDMQRRHQTWLLRRAEEIQQSSERVTSVNSSGDGNEGGAWNTKQWNMGEGKSEDAIEAGGGHAAAQGRDRQEEGRLATRLQVGATLVDSEDWTREDAAAPTGRGLQSRVAYEGTNGSAVVAAGADPAASPVASAALGAEDETAASSSKSKTGMRRLLRRQEPQKRQLELQVVREARGGVLTAKTDAATLPSVSEEMEHTVRRERDISASGGDDNGQGSAAPTTTKTTATNRRRADAEERPWGWGWAKRRESTGAIDKRERVLRLERGAELWGGTYAPPIEPKRRQALIDKWSSGKKRAEDPTGEGEDEAGRILYVISSYDRGERLGPELDVDKLDYILMMMDEMREACEVGFSPQVHLIAAWNPSEVIGLFQDRLFCQRTGEHVPFSHEEHLPSVGNNLAIKHRIYMKPRLEEFDVFLQVEDDMILTLNHILLYREECDLLQNRKGAPWSRRVNWPDVFVPGFMRVEEGGAKDGGQGQWFEWEIALSRFHAIKIYGAGAYMSLSPSRVLPRGGNNQGLWMATREQLKYMATAKGCDYLDFDESSTNGMPETHSGSIQMFLPECGFEKVFPATHFEDFMVHHRTNNKNGRKGESIPGVSTAMLRVWAEQFLRDEGFLQVVNFAIPPNHGVFP